eukprot:9272161-Ditylum_brightwellii.AAC.2
MDRGVREDASTACIYRPIMCRSHAAGMDLDVLSVNAQLTAGKLSQKDPTPVPFQSEPPKDQSCQFQIVHSDVPLFVVRDDQACFDLLWPM